MKLPISRRSPTLPSPLRPAAWPSILGFLLLASMPLLAVGCGPGTDRETTPEVMQSRTPTPHSHARPGEARVRHLDLDLTVDFEARRLEGRASLELDTNPEAEELVLDSRDLEIHGVTRDDGAGELDTGWELGPEDPILGQPLTITLDPATETVHVDYTTSPDAGALLWMEPVQTASGHPFLFTQSQAILARTWVPIQDTPGVRFTYSATVRVPPELMAVMSAENPLEKNPEGIYHFEMPQPVPSYLLALAVGDLEFRALSERAGVYAEPGVVEDAAWEFAHTEDMIAAAEELYGPYRWGRYDILVLPPAFPFGGMENPRLTFATPTILAGDRSLTALVAHELAHSWSGNLVTNATWNDFWLNEGFTTYFERRIMEEVYGPDYAEMLAALGLQDLRETLAEEEPRDTWLYLDLEGRDPDEGMTDVAYDKGSFFLRMLEEALGRETWDAFLREYFDRHAFESMTTARFLELLEAELLGPERMERLLVEEWVYGPGLPANAPRVEPKAFEQVEVQLERLADRDVLEEGAAEELETEGWNTHQWLHFLRHLPEDLSRQRMAELDAAFDFTGTGNSEILHAWLLQSIRHDYREADGALADFLTRQGRRKFLVPLYKALAETEEGRKRAREIYRRARPGYHPVSRATLDEILGWEGEA